MGAFKIINFGGILPGMSERALPAEAATRANNLLPSVTEFRPQLGSVIDEGALTIFNPRTIHRFRDGDWRAYTEWTNLARWPQNDNETERTSVTDGFGEYAPRVIDNTGEDRLLGVPPPAKPTLVLNEADYFTEEDRANAIVALRAAVLTALKNNAVRAKVGAVYTSDAIPGYIESGPEEDAAPTLLRYRVYSYTGYQGAIADAYTAAAEADVDWVRRTLLGQWVQSDGTPAWWGTGVWHYQLPYTAYGAGFKYSTAAAEAELAALEHIDAAQAAEIAARVAPLFDPTGPLAGSVVAALRASVSRLEAVLDTAPPGAIGDVSAQVEALLDTTAYQIYLAIHARAATGRRNMDGSGGA